MKAISYGRQYLDSADMNQVMETLNSDFLTQGPKVAEFEKALCEYTGAQYCLAVSNGTAALHLAVLALEIEEGSEGITSPNTFVASSNAMVYCGLSPKFADINPISYNISPEEILKTLSQKTKLLIPVHFAGRSCDMESISNIAKENKLHVIEDAAHAIGSCYPSGERVGSCAYSDLTTFSFHPVKTITTGEGGAITTNSKELYEKLLLLRSHGITKDKNLLLSNHGPWYYEMQTLGFNYRLSDLQAALGVSQLNKLDSFKEKRLQIIERYDQAFKEFEWLQIPYNVHNDLTCYHLYVIQIQFEKINLTRTEVMQKFFEAGVGTQVHYIPVHIQPFYKENFGTSEGDFPHAENYYTKCLSLPLFPAMTEDEIERVITAVHSLGDDT